MFPIFDCNITTLSVSDLLFLFIVLFSGGPAATGKLSPEALKTKKLVNNMIALTYVISILSTLGISLDKYISVQYSLRYHSLRCHIQSCFEIHCDNMGLNSYFLRSAFQCQSSSKRLVTLLGNFMHHWIITCNYSLGICNSHTLSLQGSNWVDKIP